MNIVNKEIIRKYIDNEINYIEKEISCCGFSKDLAKDILYLDSLDEKDIERIATRVNDSESLEETINEEIHYFLYHNEKEV